MAVKSNLYASNTADTSRGPSASLWKNVNVADIVQDPSQGMHFWDDFLRCGPLTANAAGLFMGDGAWASYADTGGVLVDAQQEGGILELSAGSTTAVDIVLGGLNGWARMVSAASGNAYQQAKIVFECRVAFGSIAASKRDCFIGLSDGQAALMANNGFWSAADTHVTTNNFIGFDARGSTTNPQDWGVAFNVASGTVQRPTNLTTLVTTVSGTAPIAYTAGATGALATGFQKLGFVFDPTAENQALSISSASSGQTAGTLTKPTVRFYVNGVQAPAFLNTTNLNATTFPSGWMAPLIAYRSNSGTSPGDFYIDWIRCVALPTY